MTSSLPPQHPQDEQLWLEDIDGEKQLAWAREQNAITVQAYAQSPAFEALQQGILEVLDSDDRIPMVRKIGPFFYNFWRDKEHPKGLWRRTTLDEYRKPQPAWESVLDLDALAAADKENWVWHGADCLEPDYRRCLISLSRGGADAFPPVETLKNAGPTSAVPALSCLGSVINQTPSRWPRHAALPFTCVAMLRGVQGALHCTAQQGFARAFD